MWSSNSLGGGHLPKITSTHIMEGRRRALQTINLDHEIHEPLLILKHAIFNQDLWFIMESQDQKEARKYRGEQYKVIMEV